MSTNPDYISKCTGKSLWQEYRIYQDRVEIDTHMGMMIIPFEHIETSVVSESEVKGLFRGDLHLENFRPAIKIDWANFLEHVVIDKSEGLVKRILLTPEDPEAFNDALNSALVAYRNR